MRGQAPEAFARLSPETIDAPAQKERRQGDVKEEGKECQRGRPGEDREGGQHRTGYHHGDESRCHGVGIEILDRLNVLGGKGHEIARAPAQEIGGGQRIELGEKGDAQIGKEAVCHIVREP